MAISWAFRAIVGIVALLTTVAVVVLEIANAQTRRNAATVQTTAAVATTLEGLTLVVMAVLVCMSFRHSTYYGPSKLSAIWFPLYVTGVVLATAASVVALVFVDKEEKPAEILGTSKMSYLVGTSVALGLAFTFQLSFVIIYFMGSRVQHDEKQGLSSPSGRFLPQMRMKSVPYSRTAESVIKPAEVCSFDMMSPPGSSGGETMRSSLSHRVRPMDSKTRLLSTRSSHSIKSTPSKRRGRGMSFDTMPDVEEGFDSWDTSSVDTQNRQVLDTAMPAADRFLGALETIPASPTVSRSSSPYTAADIEPPQAAMHRARSYSPVPRPPPALHSYGSTGELHIHPLFRADSPTPPPAATPGTSIVAAPEGSRTLSVKKITRMRSGSLPTTSSPLSRQGSIDSMRSKQSVSPGGRLSPIPIEPPEERQMTPPLPDWILNAGSRTSLTDYHLRKQRERDGTVDSGFESTF
ncbi:hypothetical protein PFICI_07711 [Pestalotiopsis fici W106-1]|uniref:Uncharacterized protein n=1 Tax=Pestalotiopsis fici (strain W106-1 / CGMCC3.15140) TaxID=1229662 RepID=W3X462_PESFW|nr:uncharacterized protein PFICI_07711 [Pestalotiopsis fici W106-1]ETS80182.1 hypothetical protein PFICI_07711 [Pestalotiopsis fici W106-1]